MSEKINGIEKREARLDQVLKVLSIARLSWIFIIGLAVFIWQTSALHSTLKNLDTSVGVLSEEIKEMNEDIETIKMRQERFQTDIEYLKRERN